MSAAAPRNDAIDTLRGLAAVAVLFHHARQILWVGMSEWTKAGPLNWLNPDTLAGVLSLPFRWGGWGVPLFFVISGYCIHRPEALKRKANPDYRLSLGKFAVRRVKRLYPVLLAALLLTAGLDAITRARVPEHPKLGDNSVPSFLVSAASLQYVVAEPFGSNHPLWTLAIEVQFYAVYPLLFWAIRRWSVPTVMAGVFVLSGVGWAATEAAHWHAGIFLPFWFSWACGLYLAEAEAGNVRPPGWRVLALGVPALTVAVFTDKLQGGEAALKGLTDVKPLVYTALAIPCVSLVWAAVSRPTAWAWRNPVARGLAFAGLFSYSLYATHTPVLVAYNAVVQGGQPGYLFVSVLPAVALALAVGFACYLLVERWSLRQPAKRTPSPG